MLSGISGCGYSKEEKTPTQVVAYSLDSIKSGNSADIQNMLSENLPIRINGNSGLKELLPASSQRM